MQPPAAKWREYTDAQGRVYLSNGSEQVWKWSRHRDSNTGRECAVRCPTQLANNPDTNSRSRRLADLCNYLTGATEWVTKENTHLCPAAKSSKSRSTSRTRVGANSATAALAKAHAEAKRRCGPNEEPVRNPTTGAFDIRNRATGAIRSIAFSQAASQATAPPAPTGAQRTSAKLQHPAAAALLVQRVTRMHATRLIGLLDKLRLLRAAVGGVEALVRPGAKYDIAALALAADSPRGAQSAAARKKTHELLLQLGEAVTQAMLKVDGVESMGNDVIRTHRRAAVKRLLALTESVEEARAKLGAA